MKIGFIGLGIMGESMCENIVKKHDDKVYVFDFVKGIGAGADNEFVVKLISQLNSSAILEFVNKFNPILTM